MCVCVCVVNSKICRDRGGEGRERETERVGREGVGRFGSG